MDEDDLFVDKLNASRNELSKAAKGAIDWFKEGLKKIKNPMRVFDKPGTPGIGEMMLFTYDPKYKEKLPFFDMYPLVIPIEMYSDGFLGLNLHYLPPVSRATLLDALKKVVNNDKYNETTKLNISYDILKRYSNQFPGAKNCVKRYLYSHVRSPFHKVSFSDWDKAIMMPLQKWKVNSNKKYAGAPPY